MKGGGQRRKREKKEEIRGEREKERKREREKEERRRRKGKKREKEEQEREREKEKRRREKKREMDERGRRDIYISIDPRKINLLTSTQTQKYIQEKASKLHPYPRALTAAMECRCYDATVTCHPHRLHAYETRIDQPDAHVVKEIEYLISSR